MLPTHVGLEIELCTNFQGKCQEIAEADKDGDLVLQFRSGPINITKKASGFALKNGGMIYDDVGDHIEYASPESESPLALVLGARAVQREVLSLAQTIQPERDTRINARSIARQNKKTGNGKYALFANHENYEISLVEWNKSIGELLIPLHVYSRTVFGGAGSVMRGIPRISGRTGFAHNGKFSNQTFRIQASKSTGTDRLEIRCAEDTPSDWAKFMNIATTSLFLQAMFRAPADACRLYEQIDVDEKPIASLNTLADLSGRVRTGAGHRIGLLEIQRRIHDFTRKHTPVSTLTSEYQLALSEWGKILDDLEKDQVDPFDGRVDWLGRIAFWEANREQAHARGFSDTDVCYSYDDLQTGKGFKFNTANIVRLGADHDSVDFLNTPPSALAAKRVDDIRNGRPAAFWD